MGALDVPRRRADAKDASLLPARVRHQVGRVLNRLKSAVPQGDVLVRASGMQDVYVVSGGAKRIVPSIQAFRALGYKDASVREISADVLAAIPDAPGANGHATEKREQTQNQSPLSTYESFKREAPVAELRSTEATQRIFDRLTDAQIEKIVASVTPDEAATLKASSAADRMRGIISLAAYYRQEEALAAMRLPAALPPEEVHAMSRGPFTLAGGCKYADLVVESLGGGQPILRKGARVLDFGCSSGRVVRMLAAAYPEVEWHGCDPMPGSIRWDQENLPSIKFTMSSADPPLSAYSDGMFDVVFAISIWSHFAENAALRWLAEMRRIIKPGGCLVLTTHGFRSIDYLAENHLYDVNDLGHIRDSLYSSGLCFLNVFGKKGDWGIVNSEWGQTFMSPEWLLAHVCPEWTVTEYGLGRVENNQDIYTLRRM